MKKSDKKTAYKGFDKNLMCRDFKYEIGAMYEHKGTVYVCSSGFHSCINPIDILNIYDLAQSRFCEVEISGEQSSEEENSTVASQFIFIKKELSLAEFISICADFIENNCTNKESNSGFRSMASNSGYGSKASNSGNRSMASNSGDRSMASNSGDRSMASNSGDRSMASNSGDKGVAVVTGFKSKAKAKIGNWIVVAERNAGLEILNIKTAKIDGVILKEDTYYTVINNEFVESN